MSDLNDIARMVEAQGASLEAFKAEQISRVAEIEKKAGRPFPAAAPSTSTAETWLDVKTGKAVAVLTHNDKLSAMEPKKADGLPSIGRLLRGICLGGSAPDAGELTEERKSLNIFNDPSGGYTVNGALSSTWIDNLRAGMVLSKAGARTLPMDSAQVTIAKVTGDPVISWHAESATLPDADATFGSITLSAKTCVCLVKMSLELSQDSANIESILENTINSAMAQAIDDAGLNGVSANAAAAPSGIMNLSGRNSITSIGAPTSWDFLVDGVYELMADNVQMENVGAFIAHPAVWKKMRKLKTGITNDNTPLTMPAEIAALPKLWTTSAPLVSGTTAAGVIADWRDLVFGVRKDITVRVLSETYLGSNLQIAVLAYARVDFAATRSTSFCSLEGITV